MGINMQRNKQTWNITDLTNYSNIKDASTFGSALQQIDNKLNDIKKEITYWDVYNISTAVYNQEEFESRLANLNINSSLVINTTSFSTMFNGRKTDFHSGDIVIRLKDGSDQHIKAANAGVYVPDLQAFTQDELKTYHDSYEVNQTEGIITYDRTTDKYTWHSDKGYPKNESGNDIYSNHLTITYNYETTAPLGNQGYQNFSTRIQTLSGNDSKMYGYSILGKDHCTNEKSFKFNAVYYESDNGKCPIIPVLKFFDANNQEIYSDEYTLQYDGHKYSFYLHDNSSVLIEKVVIK